MFKIDLDGKITITRGDDSGFITLFINKGTSLSPLRYVLKDDDRVYLGVFPPSGTFEEALIKKIYTKDNLDSEGDVLIRLSSSDTVQLKPGLYFYQIKIKTLENSIYDVGEWPVEEGQEFVNTIIGKTTFNIIE